MKKPYLTLFVDTAAVVSNKGGGARELCGCFPESLTKALKAKLVGG